MARLKICDNRPVLYQWDTGIEVELCECVAKEMHFVIGSNVAKRTLVNNICTIPDVCLQTAGILICYAFCIDENQRYTKHEFRLLVIDRPKPLDYVEPVDEQTSLEAVVDRLKPLVSSSPKIELLTTITADGTKTEYVINKDNVIGWVVSCELSVDISKSGLTFEVKSSDGVKMCEFYASEAYNYAYTRRCAFVYTNTSGIWRTEWYSYDSASGTTQKMNVEGDFFSPAPFCAFDCPTSNYLKISGNIIADSVFKIYTMHE